MPRRHKTRAKTSRTPAKDKVTPAVTAPGSAREIGFDYFVNMIARMGYGSQSLAEGSSYEMVRLSNNYWLMLTLYRNHWLARRIVDLPAQDMVRAWPKLVTDLEPDDIKKFDRTIDRTYTKRRLRQALKWARLYGGAGALMVIKGHEERLEEPLDLDDVNPGTYLGLIPFDRWAGISPEGAALDDMAHPREWGMPEQYKCVSPDRGESFSVHSSRILRLTGPEIPTPELQAQIYWGISVLELVFEDLRKKDNASWSILQLLFRANVIARVEPEMAGLLSGLGMNQVALQQFNARMEIQNQLLSNNSMMVLGKDADMKSMSYSFGGIGEVYAQFQMDCAGAAEISVSRLFGRTITGLGQTNDGEERLYEEKIAKDQDESLRPALDKLFPVICMSEFGEVPDDLDMHFPSIRVLTEEEKATKAATVATPVLAAFSGGVISQQVALKELRQLADSTGIFSNITDEDIENAEDTAMLPGEQNAGPESEEDPDADGEGGGEGKSGGGGGGVVEFHLKGKTKAKDARALHKRLKWHGMDISIENEAGSTRRGTDRGGNAWSVKLTHDYGYLLKTEGVDGDHLDCFVGPDSLAKEVYVIHTLKAPHFTEIDEDKCMLNFKSPAAARAAFFANYDRPEHFGNMERIPVDEFIAKALKTKGSPQLITR